MIQLEEIAEWQRVIDKVNYLNWKIKVDHFGDTIKLSIDAHVRDSEPPHNETVVYHSMTIPYPYWLYQTKTTEEWKIKQIFRFICHIQIHEASEFFTVDAKAPFHAHDHDSGYRDFEYPIMQHPEYETKKEVI